MQNSINWVALIILIAIIYVIISSVYHYIQSSKKVCGLCMDKKCVSECCSERIEYIPNPANKAKNMKQCTECRRYCKSVDCTC